MLRLFLLASLTLIRIYGHASALANDASNVFVADAYTGMVNRYLVNDQGIFGSPVPLGYSSYTVLGIALVRGRPVMVTYNPYPPSPTIGLVAGGDESTLVSSPFLVAGPDGQLVPLGIPSNLQLPKQYELVGYNGDRIFLSYDSGGGYAYDSVAAVTIDMMKGVITDVNMNFIPSRFGFGRAGKLLFP
jgi:hypothetical protein